MPGRKAEPERTVRDLERMHRLLEVGVTCGHLSANRRKRLVHGRAGREGALDEKQFHRDQGILKP